MYLFGSFTNEQDSLTVDQLKSYVNLAKSKTESLARTPIQSIIDTLDQVGKTWVRGSANYEQAFKITQNSVTFSNEMIRVSLDVIPEILDARNITSRIQADFGSLERLDKFVESQSFSGSDRAFPLGVLYHVSAGNVFLGAIDSLIMGFLTKNVSLVKLSSRNLAFPYLFAKSILEGDRQKVIAEHFALLNFPGGSTAIEQILKTESNAIIAWGGEEMIASYKTSLPLGVKFIEYGPKISIQVLTEEAWKYFGSKQCAVWICHDVCMWDQAACASPQNLFIEAGILIDELMSELSLAFSKFPYPRGHLSQDEYVEILKEKGRATYNSILHGGQFKEGADFYLHYDPTSGIRTSPLNRTLIVKSFQSLCDLENQIKPYSRYLQSCGYLASDEESKTIKNSLGILGVMRFAHLGQVMQAPIGAPHDGKMTLVELTKIVPDESDQTLEGLANDAIQNVEFYRTLRAGQFVRSLNEMPLISGADFDSANEQKLSKFLHKDRGGGYIFSSGGTSGAPKFSFYSHHEFSEVANLLAIGFKAQGITRGSTVVNYFVAGNMWSSFLAVDHALASLGACTLPIGGMADKDLTLDYIQKFKPHAIVGLPTQLVELARRSQEQQLNLSIPLILYAGEHLSLIAQKFLALVFKTEKFGSAGYASVDAGPIGFQCEHSEPGVHHLFSDHIHMEVIAGEAVITSRLRRQMPVIRLKTGDLVDLIPPDQSCKCGRRDLRFKLLGRANSQFNVWGCRLFAVDFERSLLDCGLNDALFQIEITNNAQAADIITLTIETSQQHPRFVQEICDQIYSHSKDVAHTHRREWLDKHLIIRFVSSNGIERVDRTGKIKLILDHRGTLQPSGGQ